jgi:SCP-2 sterol transfer family protein
MESMESTDNIVEFFQELGGQEHEPLLEKVRGWVRFELMEADRIDRWLVAVDEGAIAVSHSDGPAECTARLDRALFERLCRGEGNSIAAVLRGAMVCTGDVGLLFAIARIFPTVPRERQPQSSVRGSQ